MAHVLKKRRLANAGRRRRNMTPEQIRYFGTKRQKNALRNRRRNARGRRANHRRRNQGGGGIVSQAEHAAERAIHSVEQAAEDAIGAVTRQVNRRRNVGEILTVLPGNPGRRRRRNKRMAATRRRNRRRRNRVSNPRHRNRRRIGNFRRRRHNRRRSNPKVIVRYRNRRHHRRSNRRRNQGTASRMMTGNTGAVVGVLGGAFVTKMITSILPTNFNTGFLGIATTAVVATVGGQVVGRTMGNRQFGNWVTVGGLLIVALEVISQYFPAIQLPFGLSGMGLISSSNFFVPQVNQPGSMASFVRPAAIPAPVVIPATGMNGLGAATTLMGPLNQGLRSMRRVGRMR